MSRIELTAVRQYLRTIVYLSLKGNFDQIREIATKYRNDSDISTDGSSVLDVVINEIADFLGW